MFSKEMLAKIIENKRIMATFKACVKTQRSDGLFAVLIRITHNRDGAEKVPSPSLLELGG